MSAHLMRDVHFPNKEGLIHFIAENDLAQFSVIKHNEEDYELAYVAEFEDQPSMA